MSMCYWCRNKEGCKQPEWHFRAVNNDDLYCDAFNPVALPPISFGWTSPPFVTMNKSVTRRKWQPVTIKRFKKDAYYLATNKQQRFGGEPIGIGRVTADAFKQSTSEMVIEDYEYEGFKYLDDRFFEIMAAIPLFGAYKSWKKADLLLTVVPFDIIEVFPGMMAKYSTDKEIIRCVKALVKVLP